MGAGFSSRKDDADSLNNLETAVGRVRDDVQSGAPDPDSGVLPGGLGAIDHAPKDLAPGRGPRRVRLVADDAGPCVHDLAGRVQHDADPHSRSIRNRNLGPRLDLQTLMSRQLMR